MAKITEIKMFRRVNLVLAAAAVATTATICAVAAPAGAVVANNGINMTYTNVDGTGCQIVVGDQQSKILAAIGETDVTRCSHDYNLVVWTFLDFIPVSAGQEKTIAENGLAFSDNYQGDVATNNAQHPNGMWSAPPSCGSRRRPRCARPWSCTTN
jgi:hypothetical protein